MTDVLNEQFKNIIKSKIMSSVKANYQDMYNQTRLEFSNTILDPYRREEFLQTCPTANSFRSSASRARTKMVPVAPKSYHDVNFDLMGGTKNYSQYILAQDNEWGIIFLGTKSLLQTFVDAIFKSCDATYQICPKLFYQVLIFMGRIGEVYITTLFVIMPRKTREYYDKVMCS